MMSGSDRRHDPLKGWLMGFLGLFVAQIGQDGIHAYDRFTFGCDELAGGISLIPALVGAFGFAEILTVLTRAARSRPVVNSVDSVLPRIGDVLRTGAPILRSGVIGVYVGILPGRRRGHGGLVVLCGGASARARRRSSSARARSRA